MAAARKGQARLSIPMEQLSTAVSHITRTEQGSKSTESKKKHRAKNLETRTWAQEQVKHNYHIKQNN